jgi:hypothetical protein
MILYCCYSHEQIVKTNHPEHSIYKTKQGIVSTPIVYLKQYIAVTHGAAMKIMCM